MDIIGALQDGQGTLAWVTAVLLALGGTAVVVAVWLQLRRGVPAMTILKAVLGVKTGAARTEEGPEGARGTDAPATAPAEAKDSLREPVEAALNAYRAAASVAETPDTGTEDAVLTERQLNVYLARLRRAGDALEQLAARDRSRSGERDTVGATVS